MRKFLPVIFVPLLLALVPLAARAGALFTTETTTTLGGSATFTGAAHDLGASPSQPNAYVGCAAVADQTGTLNLQLSVNGTTGWATAATTSMTANVVADVGARIRAEFYRCQEVNGSSAQGSNLVQFGATSN